MDNEQTINALEELERYRQSAVVHSLSDDTIKKSIEAIKKEMPKRVILKRPIERQFVAGFFCGNCKHILAAKDKDPYSRFFKDKYCPDCGQKIDWSDFCG